jgi:nucleoside-diphosphate-sugar epimerase
MHYRSERDAMQNDTATTARSIVGPKDPILITGSNGFIGSRVVKSLLERGFRELRCLVRPSSTLTALNSAVAGHAEAHVRIIEGNLLSREDCERAAEDAAVIYHLAAGRGVKSYADAYLNSVVTTKNLLNAAVSDRGLRRFVSISSFSVYSNRKIRRRGLLDETCEEESHPDLRGDAYCFAKVGQDRLIREYEQRYGMPVVILRPGVVFGPGNNGIHGRVGIGTFGIFLHLGGANILPLSYVDNCADAIVLAGTTPGVDGQVFNVVDDELPTSRRFLRLYKRRARDFASLFVPYPVFYLFCYLWEKYSKWSEGQLPPVFNRMMCSTYWKGNRYSNEKLKKLLHWKPKVGFEEAANRYFEYQKTVEGLR